MDTRTLTLDADIFPDILRLQEMRRRLMGAPICSKYSGLYINQFRSNKSRNLLIKHLFRDWFSFRLAGLDISPTRASYTTAQVALSLNTF
jgi:hypothetical protein